jgi:hypothetical protein
MFFWKLAGPMAWSPATRQITTGYEHNEEA